MATNELELQAVIGFKGNVPHGLILHPDNEHLIYPLGSTVVIRNLIEKTQTFLQGHDDQISTLSLSPSGRYIASGQKTYMGFPADIIVWDFETRQQIRRLRLHKVSVSSISFSCNEKYLASVGGQDDNSLVVWSLTTGAAICGSPAAPDIAHDVKFFNNDDTKLITGGNYNLRLWQFDEINKKVRPTDANVASLKRKITNLVISADDTMAYCGTETGDMLEVRLTSQFSLNRTGPPGPPRGQLFSLGVTSIAILRNGDLLVGTGDGTIAKLDREKLRIKAQCKVLGGVLSLALTNDSTHFFCGTSQSNVYWVDVDSLTPELRNTCHYDRINDIVFPYNYSDVFATCSVNDIRVWNAKNKQELLRIQVPNLECFCVCFTRDGKHIVSGWSDGKIRCFLPQSGRLVYVINDAHANGVTALTATNDCSRLVSGGMEGEVRVWRIGKHTQSMEASMKEHRGRVWDLKVRSNDKEAVSASADGSCIVWNLENFSRVTCLFESTMFKKVLYHPDESQLLTTGSDRKITYWDTFDGQAIRMLDGSEGGEINTLDITRDGDHFVSGGEDRLVKLWNYDEGICHLVGVGHSGVVTQVRISPDQRMIVSAGAEGAIFVWKMPHDLRQTASNTQ
eukprot:GILK01000703.1.p1 GENE.GILK01000703.1~~GILK01000703.1.p1  ORF type:complete len:651 (-),score=98.22 GILK01000703.1:131-1999(-)